MCRVDGVVMLLQMALYGNHLNSALRDKPSRTDHLVYPSYRYIKDPMNVRLKKLIGSVLIVVIAMLYALVATTIAAAKLADASGWVHLLFFLISGLLWVVPAMFIITWMTRPPKGTDNA